MISSIIFLGSQMAVGGAQRVLFTQAQWFHEKGYRVTTAFFYDKEKLKSKWVSAYPFQVIDLEGRAVNATFFTNFLLFIGGFVRLLKLLKRNEVDVIETFTPDSNLLGMLAARIVGVPIRVASHHGYIEGSPRWRVRLHGWMVNQGFAQRLVAVSDRVRRIAIEEEGVRPELIPVILNGIKPVIQKKSHDDIWAAYQQEFGLNPGDFVYLSIGRLTVQKGHTYLLEAAVEVIDHFEGHSIFLIAGEGHLREDLEKKAVQLGLQEAVHFLGNRDDIPDLLSLADVFVLPSIWEGMPIALLEAMSAGLPVIATKVEGVENVVVDGENGILLPSKDLGALAEAMIKIRENPETLEIMGKRNSDLVKEEFTIDQMCEEYEELFQQLYQQETGK